MKTRRQKLESIRQELIDMANEEAMFLFRMARKAEKHGCSCETVQKIREEARWCHTTATAYPDRLVYFKLEYDMKYAFKI